MPGKKAAALTNSALLLKYCDNGGLRWKKTAVTVKIFNDEYTLKTDLPRTDVDAIAAMVDKKMQKLATSQHLVTTSKVAVWAALDLAGELYTLRREYEALLKAAKDI